MYKYLYLGLSSFYNQPIMKFLTHIALLKQRAQRRTYTQIHYDFNIPNYNIINIFEHTQATPTLHRPVSCCELYDMTIFLKDQLTSL